MSSYRGRKRKTGYPKRNKKRKPYYKKKPGSMKLQQIDTMGAVRAPPSQVMFDRYVAVLRYSDGTTQRVNAAANFMSWRYRMNNAFDPDPALASGSLSGFTELAAIYLNYKVLSFTCHTSLANRDAQPYNVVTAPTKPDVGLAYSGTYELGEFPYGRTRTMSIAGGMDQVHMSTTVNLSKFIGTAAYEFDPAFAGSTTSSSTPTNLVYFNVGFYGNVNQINGVFNGTRLEYEIMFYNRAILLT